MLMFFKKKERKKRSTRNRGKKYRQKDQIVNTWNNYGDYWLPFGSCTVSVSGFVSTFDSLAYLFSFFLSSLFFSASWVVDCSAILHIERPGLLFERRHRKARFFRLSMMDNRSVTVHRRCDEP